ncbi:MAG: DUF4279 domain-containing protein [Verrucomicrobiae bacterium]|nr:DUF4279 domain-containing protein [Verrucomicrobiae bacterium]
MRTYDDDYPTCVKTFATLRLYHDENPPEEVTKILGIEPSKSQSVGQPFGRSESRARVSGWFLRSENEVESKDVRRHIDWILDQIRGLESAIERLRAEGWRSDVNCYWLSIGHGGPVLDPPQMYDLARFHLTCGFDVYDEKVRG